MTSNRSVITQTSIFESPMGRSGDCLVVRRVEIRTLDFAGQFDDEPSRCVQNERNDDDDEDLETCPGHLQPPLGVERSTDGRVPVDSQENRDPNDATLSRHGDWVDVLDKIRDDAVGGRRVEGLEEPVDDGEADEGDDEDRVVGDGKGPGGGRLRPGCVCPSGGRVWRQCCRSDRGCRTCRGRQC